MHRQRILILFYLYLSHWHALSNPYCDINILHTMCLYSEYGPDCKLNVIKDYGPSATEKKLIVNLHNKFRRNIATGNEKRGINGSQPSAANMMKMSWDAELSKVAQRWADQCVARRDNIRYVARWNVGQNIYLNPDVHIDWEKVITNWYNQVTNFDPKIVDSYSYVRLARDYTQLAWHETYAVGCGRTSFDSKTIYVCNYGPSGNIKNKPVYLKGKPCTKCSKSNYCEDGLCARNNDSSGPAYYYGESPTIYYDTD